MAARIDALKAAGASYIVEQDAPDEAPKTPDSVSDVLPRPDTDAEAPAIKVRTSKTTLTAGGLVRRTIYTPAPLWARVMRRALSEGRSAADVVRDAIEAYLDDGTPAP